MSAPPAFSLGIEEEYLLVDADSLDLVEPPEAMMEACRAALEAQVSPEFLRCQVEVGTRVCAGVSEARDDLRRLRSTIRDIARNHGLAPIAVSCHPSADWRDQHATDRDRYRDLERDLADIARRMLICGMHVHVGIEDNDLRIDLMNQAGYFLPHLLALSSSSPFWQGKDTGLASYRISVFDNLPRTGLPPRFSSFAEYRRALDMVIGTGIIEDGTKIWWDIRPSDRFPTLESRICDVSPRLSHTVSLAALTQCILRMLWRLSRQNMRWRIYDAFLLGENRWRAQRYGATAGMIDFAQRRILPMERLLDDLVEMLSEDADALDCRPEIEAAQAILAGGTSAERQRGVYTASREAGEDHSAALRRVVASLIEEYSMDL